MSIYLPRTTLAGITKDLREHQQDNYHELTSGKTLNIMGINQGFEGVSIDSSSYRTGSETWMACLQY